MSFNPNDHMRTVQGGQQYLDVKWRVLWFREEHPDWIIRTTLVYQGDLVKGMKGSWDADRAAKLTRPGVIFYAEICDETGKVIATGHGSETADDFAEWLEKAETKSIGRALAMAGFGTQFASEIDDEDEQIVDSPVESKVKDYTPSTDGSGPSTQPQNAAGTKDSAGTCEDCGSPILGYNRPGGVWIPAADVAAKTKEMTGKALCLKCGAKKKVPVKS